MHLIFFDDMIDHMYRILCYIPLFKAILLSGLSGVKRCPHPALRINSRNLFEYNVPSTLRLTNCYSIFPTSFPFDISCKNFLTLSLLTRQSSVCRFKLCAIKSAWLPGVNVKFSIDIIGCFCYITEISHEIVPIIFHCIDFFLIL